LATYTLPLALVRQYAIVLASFIYFIESMRHRLAKIALQTVSALPLSCLYALAPLIYYIVRSVIHYRQKVVQKNLQAAFPDLSNSERLKIEKQFYRHLVDLTVETIKGESMSLQQMCKRFHLINPEIIEQASKQYGGALLLAPHYANWEWGICIGDQLTTPCTSFYKTLHDKKANAMLLASRSRFNMQLASVDTAARTLLKQKNTQMSYVILFDQHPNSIKKTAWMQWLNQPTEINTTPARLANKFNYPLIYLDIKRIKRGYYTLTAEKLALPVGATPKAITKLYMDKLAKQIAADPSQWLWSHKRWKTSPPTDEAIDDNN
jgi:KDO2-lipid IV(A) lauroyltransferase